jgi:hypothetical protein
LSSLKPIAMAQQPALAAAAMAAAMAMAAAVTVTSGWPRDVAIANRQRLSHQRPRRTARQRISCTR